MNTLKSFGAPHPCRFLCLVLCLKMIHSVMYCWTKLMWTKMRVSGLHWFHVCFTLCACSLSSCYMFTWRRSQWDEHLLLKGESCLSAFICLSTSPSIFHIFSHSFHEGRTERDACLSSCLCLFLCFLLVCLFTCLSTCALFMLFTWIALNFTILSVCMLSDIQIVIAAIHFLL